MTGVGTGHIRYEWCINSTLQGRGYRPWKDATYENSSWNYGMRGTDFPWVSPWTSPRGNPVTFSPEWLDERGSEVLYAPGKGEPFYTKLLATEETPASVVKILEGMGYCRGVNPTFWDIEGYTLRVLGDPDLYPILYEESGFFQLLGGTREARLRLDRRRKALDVYDTLIRSCYSGGDVMAVSRVW